MRWDTAKSTVRFEAPGDETLAKAADRYFRTRDLAILKNLERLLSPEPDTLLRQAALLMQAANTVLDEEGKELAAIVAGRGQPFVCHAGCFGCCCQLVLCQPFEAALIAVYLEACPPVLEAFEQAYPLWDAATASMRSGYLDWAERFYVDGVDDNTHHVGDYHTPCPFLDGNACCRIYPVRPHCCRSSVAVDPACACPPAPHERPGSRNLQYSLYTGHHQARKNILEILLQRSSLPSRPVPMPQLVRGFIPTGGIARL